MRVAHVQRTNLKPSKFVLLTLRDCIRTMFTGITPDDDSAFMTFFADLFASEPGRVFDIHASFPRNGRFHRKFFAMLNAAFEVWEPPADSATSVTYRGQDCAVAKDFDQFRADVTIMAGFYEATYQVNGEVRLRPKSISFASMDDVEFERVYNAVFNTIIEKVLAHYTTADLTRRVEELLAFT